MTMRLIGMLDSPYVRRVAISLDCLGVSFLHEPVSVFSTFEEFRRVNPVVKAPTVVCDDGTVLMDSSLILDYVEKTHAGGSSLWSRDASVLRRETRVVGLALAACDKGVQLIYEQNLRPPEARYEPWLARVRGQLFAAMAGLEREAGSPRADFGISPSQTVISTAVAWQFLHAMLPDLVARAAYPALAALSAHMESTPVFRRYPPDGPGVPPDAGR